MSDLPPDPKAVQKALMTAKSGMPATRQLSPQGLYSYGAETAAKLGNQKGAPNQMLAALKNKGVKDREIELSGVKDAVADKPQVSGQDLAEMFQKGMPNIGEDQRGGGDPWIHPDYPHLQTHEDWSQVLSDARKNYYASQDMSPEKRDALYSEYQKIDDAKDLWERKQPQEQTSFDRYRYPGGSKYRELILHLPDYGKKYQKAIPVSDVHKKIYDNIKSDYGEVKGYDGEELDPSNIFNHRAFHDYNKRVKNSFGIDRYDDAIPMNDDYNFDHYLVGSRPQYRYTSHWDTKNPAVHLRMTDRKSLNHPDDRLLHMDELQSDWGQQAREKGSYDPATPYSVYQDSLPIYPDETSKVESYHPTQIEANTRARELNSQRPTPIDRYASTSAEYLGKIPKGPYSENTAHWMDLGLKRLLTEAARGPYTHVTWTRGEDNANVYNMTREVHGMHVTPFYPDGSKGLVHYNVKTHGPHGREGEYNDTFTMTPSQLYSWFGADNAKAALAKVKFPQREQGFAVQNKHSGNRDGYIFPTREEAEARLREFPAHMHDSLETIASPPKWTEGVGAYHAIPGGVLMRGEGMKSFYNKMVPQALEKLAKEHDPHAKIGTRRIETGGYPFDDETEVQALEMTPQMRHSILKNGFKAYRRGGFVDRPTKAAGGALNPALVNRAMAVASQLANKISPGAGNVSMPLAGRPVPLQSRKS